MAAGDKIEVENVTYRLLNCGECTKTFTANFGKGGTQNVIVVEHTSNGHAFKTVRTK